MSETKRVITTSKAASPKAPYSQGMLVGNLLFCSGQIGLSPETGEFVSSDVAGQTRQILQNISAILSEAGCSLSDLVKVTIYLTSMDDFQAVNEIYRTFLSAPYPARTTIAVAGLPLGALIEIEAIAQYH